jgi:hypothetical protein
MGGGFRISKRNEPFFSKLLENVACAHFLSPWAKKLADDFRFP